jgi:hypothetical protein
MNAQFKPFESQCSHWYVKLVGGAFTPQVPVDVEIVCPGTKVPEIAGRTVF